jgi:D-3-phosphoglycerate dehydrogenase / 2-oxoglutarate reductase
LICLVIQPIHQSGTEILRRAGLEVRAASAATMDVVAREIAPAVAAITRNAGLDRHAMRAARKLCVLGNHGIGVDAVDVAYATEIGLPVAFTPYANVQSVAELALGHMLALARRVREADAAVRQGHFDYRYSRAFREISGKTLLIVGFGRTGRRTAEIARTAFAMRVLVHSPRVGREVVSAAGFVYAENLDAALAAADVVSLHETLTPATRGLFNRDRLSAMKPGALLINTARGALIDQDALIAAVEGGRLGGVALDVFDKEPLPAGHPLTLHPAILLSPHIGGATEEALERTAVQAASFVVDALNGRRPEHLVNPEVWDRRRMPATLAA